MTISIVGKTDIGKHRDQNEDAFIFCPDLAHPDWNQTEAEAELGKLGALLAVADGMGGANAGEVASAIAMETIKKCFSNPDIVSVVADETHIRAFLEASVDAADKAIQDHILRNPKTIGMGTTIVVCWILNNQAFVTWCGDSRCYVFNPRTGLKALTKDHSYVQDLIDKGVLTEEESLTHPDSNLITRGLGDLDISAEADTIMYSFHSNDAFLLCTDGLCGYCNHSTIENVVNTYYHNINECCDKLMGLALDAGGCDNICIALASISDETEQPQTSSLKSFFKKLFF